MKAAGFRGFLPPANPDAANASWGVGLFVRGPVAIHRLAPKTSGFQKSFDFGRAAIAIVSPCGHFPVMIAVVYGWASDASGDRHGRTSAVFFSVLLEAAEWPSMLLFCFAGLNADVADAAA
eukprot:11540128-Alexandrium_andersonii.AAC.1